MKIMGVVIVSIIGAFFGLLMVGWSDGSQSQAGATTAGSDQNAMMIPVEPPKAAEPSTALSDADLLNAEPLVAQARSVSTLSGGSGDGVATLINLQGELCGKVVSVTKLKRHRYDIICEENRDGSGWVRHRLDAKDGSVTFIVRADSPRRL